MVQPYTHFGEGAREKNLASAEKYVVEAVAGGAQLVCFPETYPGEWRAPVRWTPEDELSSLAKQYGVYLVGGFVEPLDAEGVKGYNTFTMHGPSGEKVAHYRRTTPRHTPWIYRGGEYWDFDWVSATDLPVWKTDLGTIGILMCSEVYATECVRAMAIQGADLTLLPAGLPGTKSPMFETWRTLIWARSIENLMFTAMCSNIPVTQEQPTGNGTGGMAMVCSPEEILLESQDEGVFQVNLDMDRLKLLREDYDRLIIEQEDQLDTPWRTKPGIMRDWRRDAVLQANTVLLTGAPDETD